MNRTDTEMLDFLLGVMAGTAENDGNAHALHAAYQLGHSGREAISLAMGARVFEPGEPLPPATALDLIADEVKRVREVEGFTTAGDDTYEFDELACAAACYLLPADSRSEVDDLPAEWPQWPLTWRRFWKPTPGDRLRELVKGSALAACEIDRLLRKPTEVRRSHGIDFGSDTCTSCDGRVDPGADHVCPADSGSATGEPCAECGNIGAHNVECPAMSTLKVGDRVRMVRADTEWSGWVPAMTAMIGKEYVVERIIPKSWIMGPMVQIDGWNISSRCVEVIQ